MSTDVIVYQSKMKQVGLSLLGLGMVVLSLFVAFAGSIESNYLILTLGILSAVFFGICDIYIFKQLIKGKELVILTDDGFYDYSSAIATNDLLVSWSDVDRIQSKQVINQTFVSIYLKTPDKYLSQLSSYKQKLIAANIEMGLGEINIVLQNAKNCSQEELIELMNGYLNDNIPSGFEAY